MIHGFDDNAFQERIDRLTGLNRDGKSVLRLVHAPSVMTWALGEVVPRYWTSRRKEKGVWRYDQPDRWVIERRIEKEAYWDAHERTRYQVIDATGEVVDLGPPPEDFYVFDYLIARHDAHTAESGEPLCCENAWTGETTYVPNWEGVLVPKQVGGRQRCWGEYREPDDSDIQLVAEAVKRMKEDKYFSPYAPLSPEQLAAIEVNANLAADRIAEEARKRMEEHSREFTRLHGWRLGNTDAGKRSKYFFLTR